MNDPNQQSEPFIETLGPFLVERGKLDPVGLDRAERLRAETGERLDHILTKLGLVSETDMAEAFSVGLALPLVTASDFPAEPVLDEKISVNFLRETRAVPIADTAEGLEVAMSDPLDSYAIKAIGMTAGCRRISRRR